MFQRALKAAAIWAVVWAGAAQALSVDHLSILTYRGKVQVEVLVSDAEPVKDVAAFDATGQLLFRRDCPGTPVCRAVFLLEAIDSPQRTLTVLATNHNGKSTSEVFTVQVEEDVARVYVLNKIQDQSQLLPLGGFDFLNKDLVAGTVPSPMAAATPGAGTVPSHGPTDELPDIELGHYLDGDKLVLSAKATSQHGMDSIAILENGLFLDVELCKGDKACTFTKILSRESGRYNYMFKARTLGGAQREEELLVDLP